MTGTGYMPLIFPRRDELDSRQTMARIIREHVRARPNKAALMGGENHVVSYDDLDRFTTAFGDVLRGSSVGAEDWVAVALPDGMELAMTIVAVTAHAIAVPINPDIGAAEIEALFALPRMTAVIVAEDDMRVAIQARAHGLGLLSVFRTQDGHSVAAKNCSDRDRRSLRKQTEDQTAFVLRTSGTTAQSKLIAVTHRNLLATAAAVEEWFALTSDDKVLCALPLHYAVALKVGLFTTLLSGGSVICVPPSRGGDLLDWIQRGEPSWYSASPAVHRAVLEHAIGRAPPIRHALRFIHSGAAPLSDSVQSGLEALFAVPVLQTYGLSEAGLVAANGTTPEGRRRGTVGRRRAGELACRSDDGRILKDGEQGEIVVRGPGVMPGYVDNPEANAVSFVDGWFRTGDVGCVDQDGFVTIIGRLNEMINRGGEKVVPSEVDRALLLHPAVAEAASFAIPHPRLGEDIAAAVVLRAGKDATALELRQFLQTMLAPHKIPRRIHLVSSMPRNATGKVPRHELAQSLLVGKAVAPRPLWASPLEVQIAEIWRRLLRIEDIDRNDEFFEIGGDSLLEAQMLLELEQLTGRTLPESVLFESATVPHLAEAIVRNDTTSAKDLLIEVQPGAGRLPFIFVDGDFWGGGYYTRKIARLLGSEYPFYDLRSHGLHDNGIPSIEVMARDYLPLVRRVQPHGPYRIGGHCNGALAALSLANLLEASGECVELVILVEPITLNARPVFRILARSLDVVLRIMIADATRRQELLSAAMSQAWHVIRRARRVRRGGKRGNSVEDDLDAQTQRIRKFNVVAADRHARLLNQYRRAMAGYLPAPLRANLLCIMAESHQDDVAFAGQVCHRLAECSELAVVPGDHLTCITTHVEVLTQLIRQHLCALDAAKIAMASTIERGG